MPRNDQAVRQLVILNKLEASRHGLTLSQLTEAIDSAATRHPRTLRRDLAAIESAGWPVLTERIDGQVCWKLLEGFRNIPALRLSPSELMALTVSRRLIAPLEGTELHASLQSALGKASAALPPQGLELAQQLEHTFSIGLGPHKRYRHHREVVEQYQPDNSLNPANTYDPSSAFNPVNRYDPGNPENPVNRYNPNNPFNPVNQYHPDNPLNPANKYSPNVPFAPLDGGGRTGKTR
jgi:hypothetical protein